MTLYEQALALDPNLFEAHLAMGIALDLEGRYADARGHLTRAVALAPADGKLPALNAMAVSYAFGSFEMKSCACAAFAASSMSFGVASSRP